MSNNVFLHMSSDQRHDAYYGILLRMNQKRPVIPGQRYSSETKLREIVEAARDMGDAWVDLGVISRFMKGL